MDEHRLRREGAALKARTDRLAMSDSELRAGRQRLRERFSPPSRRSLWPYLGAVGAATAAAVAVLVQVGDRRPPQEASWYLAERGGTCIAASNGEVAVRERCQTPVTLKIGDDRVELAAGAALERARQQLVFRRGRARLKVRQRRLGERRFSLQVSGGLIEVIGTEFTVVQSGSNGELSVQRGIVGFDWQDGTPPERLTAGERLTWPRAQPEVPVAAEPPTEPMPPPPTVRPSIAAERRAQTLRVEKVMQRQFQLRSQARYDEAAQVLRRAAQTSTYSKVQRERFGYELGQLLVQQGDRRAVCQHWRSHLRKFPKIGRRPEVVRSVRACR